MRNEHSSRLGAAWRWSHTSLLSATLTLATLGAAAPRLVGQPVAPPAPEPLPAEADLGDPVVDADATFHATRVTAWNEGDAQVLLLEGDAWFRVGAYGFRAERLVARIDRRQRPGERITHLAIYLDHARSLEGGARVTAEAPRLLVTAATRGDVNLEADAFTRAAAAPADPFVADAERRIAGYRRNLQQASRFDRAPEPLYGPEAEQVREARRAAIAQAQLAEAVQRLPRATPADAAEPDISAPPDAALAEADGPDAAPAEDAPPEGGTVLPTQGAVYISADQLAGSTRDNTLMLIGDARVVYESYSGAERDVALKAEKIVVFLRPESEADEAPATDADPAEAGSDLQAGDIEGVYLEENVVVTDGLFTVRAPRMYFDLAQNRAVLLDAVVYAYDVQRQVPLYLRAELVRQTSATSLEAENALLTTSEFAEPHVAIAADRVTLRRNATGETIETFTASGNTIRVGNVPVFYWPYLAGSNRDTPLRRISGGYSSNDGLELETWWDIFALAGETRPDGVDALLRLDYLGEHGPAVGLVAEYERPLMFGALNTYFLPNDNGADDIGSRLDVEHDGDTRGIFHWQHRHALPNDIELSLETTYLSDETFLEQFFDDETYESREYETSAYLKKQQDDWAATFLVKYNINDFTPLTTTLQTPGYTVDKLPEVGFYRIGTSFWNDRLTYFTENRAGGVQIRPGDDAPEDRGFTDPVSMELFGIAAGTDFDDAFDAAGYPVNDLVWRLDSRHEINAPMQAGIFEVTPYVVGRFTGYSEDFEAYSDEDDQVRLWGQLGTRLATQFTRTYAGVENDLLDVHRLRHVIEPHANLFATAATLSEDELPVYDYSVENLDDGAGVLLGLTNRFQTQRGGVPGSEARWRSVDWIVLKTDLVLREDDDDPFAADEADIARFFDYRPELSTGGDHFYTELLWMVTDTFGVTGELTHSFESDEIVQWRLGGSIQHSPNLLTYAEYEEYEALELQLVRYGLSYQLTTKYRLGISHRLDLGETGAERITASLERKLPRWRVRVMGSYSESRDETTVGLILIPEGFDISSPQVPLDSVLGAF